MANAKSILESQHAKIGQRAKIKAIQEWAIDFFAGIDNEPINNSGYVNVGCAEDGWIFTTDFRGSYFTVDCDLFEGGWQDMGALRFNFADISVDTIGKVLEEHFAAVISNALFIKV